jgi:hypothetical protein
MHAQLARWHLRVERKSQVEARPLSMDETPLTSAGPAPAMIVAREQSTNRLQVGMSLPVRGIKLNARLVPVIEKLREPADSEHARAQEVASTVTHTGRSTTEAPGRGGSTDY